MRRYPVLDTLDHDQVRYAPGTGRDVVDLDGATAARLQASGIIGPALPMPEAPAAGGSAGMGAPMPHADPVDEAADVAPSTRRRRKP